MSNGAGCHCHSCTIRGLMWPAVLITLGILFLIDRAHVGPFYFSHTWPVVLVVMGLVQLACSVASREGHIENTPAAVPPNLPPVAPPPANTPPLSPEGR